MDSATKNFSSKLLSSEQVQVESELLPPAKVRQSAGSAMNTIDVLFFLQRQKVVSQGPFPMAEMHRWQG